ncbi:MAG: hypothetical protein HY873_09905, partial [Chloroflexi bacterium]|nr:hypothetical protein [Chloroflexota bacterium]
MKTQQDVRWLSLEQWDACAGNGMVVSDESPLDDEMSDCAPTDEAEPRRDVRSDEAEPGRNAGRPSDSSSFDPQRYFSAFQEPLRGRDCFAGLDLSTTTDVSALVMVFPDEDGGVTVLPKFWIPAENARTRERRDRVPYETWARQGLIEMTPGNVVDYDVIRQRIAEWREAFNIREVAIDPWNATHITTQLTGDGIPVVTFGQGCKDMTAPTKEWEKLILCRKLRHGGNPVLRWMAGNVAVETDAAGNLKPSNKKSTERIDGIVAGIMALGRAGLAPPPWDGTLIFLS